MNQTVSSLYADGTPKDLAWAYVTDTVMGGVSRGTLTCETILGREAWRLRGAVSLDNNGGFIQMAANLREDGGNVDASGLEGVAFDAVDGMAAQSLRDGETYNLHLRTADLTRPWQSYRQSFIAGPQWEAHRIPFSDFAAHRTDAPLDLSKLRRIGILAIGRAFEADLGIANVRLY